MKILLFLVVVLVIAAGVVGFLGAQIPPAHTITRSVTVAAPPERVYGLISNVSDEPRWRPSVKQVTILPNIGTHMQWSEKTTGGTYPMELVTDNAPLERVVRIADPDLPFQGTWTYDLQPQGQNTVVTITENGRVPNVFFRFVSHYVMGETKTADDYLADLSRVASQPG